MAKLYIWSTLSGLKIETNNLLDSYSKKFLYPLNICLWFEPASPALVEWQNFFFTSLFDTRSSAALWHTVTHSTSLERSKPPLLTQFLSKSLAALLVYFISVQSTLISIGFISKGAVFVGPICSWMQCEHYIKCKLTFNGI